MSAPSVGGLVIDRVAGAAVLDAEAAAIAAALQAIEVVRIILPGRGQLARCRPDPLRGRVRPGQAGTGYQQTGGNDNRYRSHEENLSALFDIRLEAERAIKAVG